MPAIKTGDGPCLSGALLRRICFGLVIAGLASSAAVAEDLPGDAAATANAPATPKLANFDGARAPDDVRQAANWVVDSGDNRGLAFVIVEKPQAQVFVFDASGKILGMAPALVGLAPGDDSVPGIGTKSLAEISPEMRTTPAGRFVASLGPDLGKLDVLWVDYADAISLHRVINTKPKERRLQRLASPTPLDNRISYGCINVPAKFFDRVVQPAFTGTSGIVYILPEIKSMHDVFPTYYDVGAHSGLQNVSLPAPAP